MKIDDNLKKIIKELNGSLIGIGINDKKIIDVIGKNKKIVECNLLDCYTPETTDLGKIKKLSNKKLRKKFKKHRTDNIICNLENIKEFKEKFVYDSIYIGKNKIYVFTPTISDEIYRRYKRFANINLIKCSDGFIYEIEVTKKLNKFNEFYYKLIDNVIDVIDIISNLLSDS